MIEWNNTKKLPSQKFVCGYCNNDISSNQGFSGLDKEHNVSVCIYICHHCNQPTYFDFEQKQFPGIPFGEAVKSINSKDVEHLYEEARNCMKVSAFTAAVMCCRKLLMNIAVSQGAAQSLKYYEYVDYLSSNNFIPPKGKQWVSLIRDKGNDANHEIPNMNEKDARALIIFVEMLLKFIYEFPAMADSL